MNRKIAAILFFIFILWPHIYSQDLRFTHISTKEGLPNSLVFAITQDKNGFIWFGTNKGLARYDGYNFRVFLPDPQKPFGISDKSVFRLQYDYKDNMWLSVQGRGLNKMNLKTEKFVYYFPDGSNNFSLSGNDVRQIYQHQDSSIWVASNKGLDLYDSINDRFVRLLNPDLYNENTYPSNFVHHITGDNHLNIWFLTSRGIGCYNRETKSISSFGLLVGNKMLDTLTIHFILLSKNKDLLWFCTENSGLFCYNIGNGSISRYLTNYQNLRSIYIDKNENLFVYADNPANTMIVIPQSDFKNDKIAKYPMFNGPSIFSPIRYAENKTGDIFIACVQGLVKYNSKTGITAYRSNPNTPTSLIDNNVEALFIDNTEILWASIYRKGIDKADLKQKSFNWYVHDPVKKDKSIAGNNVSVIYEDRSGKLWVGCHEAGITRIDLKDNSFTTIPNKIGDPTKINFNAPAAIYEDVFGFIWVGYYDGQLDKIDPNTFKITHYLSSYPANHPNRFEGWNLRKILADKFNNLWFVTSMGIVELHRKTNKFIYHSLLYEENYLQNYLYRTMYIGNDGFIWAGSQNGGLIKYDTTAKQFTHYLNKPYDATSISNNFVYAIYEDADNKMWIGTSKGLDLFDKKTGKFNRISINEGLDKYAIFSIFPDKNNYFWMSSDNGLIKFNKQNSTFINYYEGDGLPGNEFSTTAHCLSKSGEIFLGTPRGMVSFNPQEISINPYNAHPIITDLKIFNKSIAPGDSLNGRAVLSKQIWATDKIELSYKENDFILEFSALHYAAPEKIKYSYILEGFSNNWVNTDAQRHWAVFTGLPPGNYKFRLKATNNDGIICKEEDEVSLSIIIVPPFYKTTWFILLALLLIVAEALYLIRKRINKFKNQKIVLEKKVRERTKELEDANVLLEEKQEEIYLQKEEIISQRDALEENNRTLTKQHEQISKQNKELDIHRNKLESLVVERTKKLEEALYKAEESDRLKSSFLANMSHEIRTPMNAIIGFSNLLREKDIDNTTKDNFISIILSNSESLLILINDILDLSKIQADQLSLNPTFINLLPLLHEVHDSFRLEASKKGIDFNLKGIEIKENFLIGTDRTRLKQVLNNLISNSLKFTNKGSIEFGVKQVSKDITFYVTDTGIGIPENTGNAIFERFLKLEESKDTLFGGAGLGLAICRSLVELWGGKIWYESIPDKQTTFYFTHPISVAAHSKKEPGAKLPFVDCPDLSGKHILVAEDDENNFKLLKLFLSYTNATIHWAKDGQEAIDLALSQPIDIVLMDIKLPVLDGMEATKQIKASKPKLPVIAQTAFAYENETNEFTKAGIDAYLIKPIKMADTIEMLKKYLF